MYLTVTLFLKTKPQDELILERYKKLFHSEIERIISVYNKQKAITFFPYREVDNGISFFSKNQVIHYAEVLYQKRQKIPNVPCLNLFSLSAKSFCLKERQLILNFGKTFSSVPLYIDIDLHPQQSERIAMGDIIKMDIKKEFKGYYAKIIVHIKDTASLSNNKNVMGVDIGMRCPAVCFTSQGDIFFAGNGRQIRYYNRRHDTYVRKNKNNFRRLVKFNHKAMKYKNHIDHCISKQLIEYAIQHDIGTIKLEKLTNLQKKFHVHEQVCWSYERLQTYIKYKAKLNGIKVVYVDPRFTSKRCPHCGKLNNVHNRNYVCPCGFRKHRDIVGAMNILHAPEVYYDLP